MGKRKGKLCDKEIALKPPRLYSGEGWGEGKEYQDFMDKTGDYFKDKKEMAGYLLE